MAYSFNFTESDYIPDSYDFDFGAEEEITVYSVLAGVSNNFTSIWADVDASLSTGKIYIASPAAFSIVNNNVLVDYYTTTFGGRANESLDQEDIIDINIVI